MNVISSRRARATGTTVLVIDNRDGSFDADDDLGWFTLCEPHGNFCSHPTRKLAEEWAPHPDEWCPTCQEPDEDRDETGRQERAEELAAEPDDPAWSAWAAGRPLPERTHR